MTGERGDRLAVYLNTTLVGHLTNESDQVVGFEYDDGYVDRVDATPLSLSLPLTAEQHPAGRVAAFLWGLLPDNENTLDRIAIDAGTSARNVFGLLAHVGRDTAGALQILGLDVDPHGPGGIEWIDAGELAVRLAEVRRSAATGIPPQHDNGRWSLAGAHGKLALRYADGRWGIPYGAEPTTHILKPAVTGFAESDVNEAVLLTAARDLGLPAARTSVLRLPDETHVLVSQRYDRSRDGDTWTRVHQEDLCQALGVAPSQKYQSDGGPGIEAIGSLFRRLPPIQARGSAERFLDALAFSYAIASTDGHAKNYSLLLAAGSATLAPLYDVNSALPYTRPYGRRYDSVRKLHAAIRLGRTDAFTRVEAQDWGTVARQLDLDPERVIERVREILARTPDAVEAASSEVVNKAQLDATTRTAWTQILTNYQTHLHATASTDGAA